MRIFHKSTHFKDVPKKFEPIRDMIPDLMLYEEHKRLHASERAILEKALLKHYYSSFIEKIKTNDPSVFEYLKGSEPDSFRRIERRNNDVEYVITFTNKKRVRCSRSDFPGITFGYGFFR
jgi:deoxyadenosine/deoxycytidine kinase